MIQWHILLFHVTEHIKVTTLPNHRGPFANNIQYIYRIDSFGNKRYYVKATDGTGWMGCQEHTAMQQTPFST